MSVGKSCSRTAQHSTEARKRLPRYNMSRCLTRSSFILIGQAVRLTRVAPPPNNLKGAIAQWIASSGRPTAIVEDPGLQTVMRVALQNTHYTLPSRRTIDSIIARMYDEKLQEHRNTVEVWHSLPTFGRPITTNPTVA